MKQEDKIQLAKNNEHVPTGQIEKDILDTEAEIRVMGIELESFEKLKDRMSHMRASHRKSGIKKRKEFVEQLKAILEIRKQNETRK